jgi:hypothetical protein
MGTLACQEAADGPWLAVVGAEGRQQLGNEVRDLRLGRVCRAVADVDLLG